MDSQSELIYACAKGSKGVASDLKVLLCEGDTDEGNTKNDTDDELDDRKEQTAEHEPESISKGMLLKVGSNSLSEGEEGEACHLEALDTYGDTDKGHTPNKTEHGPDKTGYKTAGYKPKNVA